MTVSFTSISPSIGHSGGGTVVLITGVDFVVAPAPPAEGPAPTPPPTMRVLIGGREATGVGVISGTELWCLTPKGDPGAAQDVVVQTIDEDGVVLEEDTGVGAFTFVRPDITEDGTGVRTLRAFIQELQRQVLPNVHYSAHSDYDANTGDQMSFAYVQHLPALVITNFEPVENRTASNATPEEDRLTSTIFVQRRPPRVVDFVFTLVGVTDNPMAVLNLKEIVEGFFDKNPFLDVPRDDSRLDRLEMLWSFQSGVAVTHYGDDAKARNVEGFSGQVRINNIRIEHIPGLPRQKPPGFPAEGAYEANNRVGWISRNDAGAVELNPILKK